MSNNQDSQNNDIPTQESATDATNQDTRISYDPVYSLNLNLNCNKPPPSLAGR